jgi:hypothetical protein
VGDVEPPSVDEIIKPHVLSGGFVQSTGGSDSANGLKNRKKPLVNTKLKINAVVMFDFKVANCYVSFLIANIAPHAATIVPNNTSG